MGMVVTLATVPPGHSGAVLSVLFSAQAQAYGYLEACMRALIDGATEPMFLSSGAEDVRAAAAAAAAAAACRALCRPRLS